MSKLDKLKTCSTLGDVAALLGFKPKALSYLIYKQAPALRYRTFEIPKRSGGTRSIQAPYPALMKIQRRLASLLQDCEEEIHKVTGFHATQSHGFTRNRSIMTNAAGHKNKRHVLNCDLENFFGSINFGRIRGFFLKNKNYTLHPTVATTLAQIVCHNGQLPQGAPTSPVISNLIAQSLDSRLSKLAKTHSCYYTRYADDITFSTNLSSFPVKVASNDNLGATIIGKSLRRTIIESGFLENPKKTRLATKPLRQEVTGLVVNKKVATSAAYRRTTRAMTHSLITRGHFETEKKTKQPDGTILETKAIGSLECLQGRLGFINLVSEYNKSNQHAKHIKKTSPKPHHITADEIVYRNFLFYKTFYSPAIPLLLCEGKTDNTYIYYAIRRLFAQFSSLGNLKKDGTFVSRVKFHKNTKTTHRIMGLDGGSSNLASFIRNYGKWWDVNKHKCEHKAIVIIIDNDDGASAVRTAVKNVSGNEFPASASHCHITHNLYITQTPLTGANKKSAIEDLFKPETLNETLNGKKFHPEVNRPGFSRQSSAV
ncbi:TPA: retron Ec67 family RNA-directed DNA polymerase/endonuclease [Stenotrophomonas maltophilia]|nr:retron Ec67 family RNA-directed DNA polymerase/endonuclease [Stenotrophomonas maltophilia]